MINIYLFIYILFNRLLKKLNCNSIEKGENLIINEDSEDILDFTYEYENELKGNFFISSKKQYKYMSILITFPEDYSKMEYNLKYSLTGTIFSYGSILVPYGYYSNKNLTFEFYCYSGCNFSLEFHFGEQGYMRQYILKNVIKMIREFNNTLDFIFIPNEKEDHNYLATISTTNIDDINMTIIGDNEKNYEIKRSELFYSYYSSISNSKKYSFIINNSNIDNLTLTIFDRKLNINQKLFKIDYLLYHYADSNGEESCNLIEGIKERWQIRALSDFPIKLSYESENYETSNDTMTVIQKYIDNKNFMCLHKINEDSLVLIQLLDVSSNEYSHNFLDPLFINVTNPDYLDSNGVKFYSFEPYDFKYYYNYTFIIRNISGYINVYSYNCKTYPNCNFSASDIESFIKKNETIKLEYNSIDNYFKYSKNQHDFSRNQIILIHCDDPIICEYNIKLTEEINAITSGQLYILNQTGGILEYAFFGNSESDYFYLKVNGNKNYLTMFVNPSEYEDVNLYYIIYDENDKNNKLKGFVGYQGSIFLPYNLYNNKILRVEFYTSILLRVEFKFYFDDKIYLKNFVYTYLKLINYFNNILQISYFSLESYFIAVKSLNNKKISIKINEENLDYNSKFNCYFLDKYSSLETHTIVINFETNDYISMSIIPYSILMSLGSQLFNINFNYINYIEPNKSNIINLNLGDNNTKYEISIVTNDTIKIQLYEVEEDIKPNYRYLYTLPTNQNFIKVISNNYSLYQMQLINGTKREDNYYYLLNSLLLNSTNYDILNDNEVRFYSIDYLNSSFFSSNKYVFKINSIEGDVSAYIHKCISYPYCIYNSSYIQKLIDEKDKNLLIFNKEKTYLNYEIENIENFNIENVLIIQCGNAECKIEINIENNYITFKKNIKAAIMIIFIFLCYILVISIIIFLIKKYRNKNKIYNSLIEQVNPQTSNNNNNKNI